jgi:hypothetical protein
METGSQERDLHEDFVTYSPDKTDFQFEDRATLEMTFTGEIWFWKGPSPFWFVTVPCAQCHALKEVSGLVTYGWGMIPVIAQIGETSWETSLWPKDGAYIVPIKTIIQRSETLNIGDSVTIRLRVAPRQSPRAFKDC